MGFLKEEFKEGLTGVFNIFNPSHENFILNRLNPLHEKFILKDIFGWLNPLSENFIGYKITSLIGDLLHKLFVPERDHFGELRNIFNEKFGFFEQIKELASHLFSFNYTQAVSAEGSSSEEFIDISGDYPGFNISYYGYEFSIIDFSILDKYRSYLHAIIVAILWISYVFRLFKRIPGIIGGFDVSDVISK